MTSKRACRSNDPPAHPGAYRSRRYARSALTAAPSSPVAPCLPDDWRYPTVGFPAWLDGASPCVRAELRRCGWNPDRGIGVDHWIEEIVRDGFVLHDLAVSMWRSLGGLELVNLDRSNSILIDPTDVQGYLTAPFDEWPKRYGQRFCPLGEWNVVTTCS
ncbi:SUKH-3 domain-containing protein [Verrucosispora sp. ts21]|uniref:SUKH-3 domain-containing protein n=1 Tax=Verrucosispora sp. ts21 TaxID=2069341 RepID=UPI0011AFC1D7